MKFDIIDNSSDLEQVCRQARECDQVMLDTEFVRTRTFFPQLGLIQLYDGERLSLIDPTCIDDLSAFKALLQDTSVLKVLHACGEDLEVFKNSFGCMPIPMVDTQIMAAFLGHGLSTGFAAMVQEYLEVELDKSESRTDWLARPLSPRQLEYAAADVYYLKPLFEALEEKVTAAGWWQAAIQESDLQAEKRQLNIEPETAYRDIKGAWQLRPEQLAILKPLACWRVQEALKRDLALNFVVKEQDLWAIARYGIKSSRKMEEQGMDPRAVRRHGERLVAMVKKAEQTPAEEYPERIERLMDNPAYKQKFKLLKDEVKKVSVTSGLATEFLASKKQLNQFISWVWRKERNPAELPDICTGWRKELLGDKLDKLI